MDFNIILALSISDISINSITLKTPSLVQFLSDISISAVDALLFTI